MHIVPPAVQLTQAENLNHKRYSNVAKCKLQGNPTS